MPDLSICIVNYNTKKLTFECIESLYQNLHNVNFEIIVVDNGSNDGLAETIKTNFPEVRLIRNVQNLGFSKANNQAIKASESEFILLLNSDTYCVNDVVKKMLNFIKKERSAGIVGIRLLHPNMSIQRDTFTLPSWKTVLYHLLNIKKLIPEFAKNVLAKYSSFFDLILGKEVGNYLKYEKLTHPITVENISGACMMIRREAIKSIGYLDENIFLYYEDIDFCRRMLKSGWKLWLIPDIGIVHYGSASFKQSFFPFSAERYKGAIYYFSKHEGIAKNLIIRVIFLAFLPIRSMFSILLSKNIKKRELFKNNLKWLIELLFSPLQIRGSDKDLYAAKYTKFERKVAKSIENLPYMRKTIKPLYQKLCYIKYRKKGFVFKLHKQASIKSILEGDGDNVEAFFGYYDKSPWSFDDLYYLTHIFRHKLKNRVSIAAYNLKTNDLRILGETPAFNFQQGAMLGWLNKENYQCIFNTISDNNLVAKIVDVESGKEIRTIKMPIYATNPKGTEALTLNFKRLNKLRPEYGYNLKVENFYERMNSDRDGIWRIDLRNNESTLIITLAQLQSICHTRTMDNSQHKVNHIVYSPSGKRFAFIHRWIGPSGKFSRLFTSDAHGLDLYCLADDRMVSHYCWLNDDHIIAWARREPIGDRYFLFKDRTNEFKIIGDGKLDINGDGHPSISPDGEWMVTDTYPNKARIRDLILFNLKTDETIVIGSFFAPWKYDGPYRCDLHPRWSHSGTKISIDSVHEGFRNSYIIDVSEIVMK